MAPEWSVLVQEKVQKGQLIPFPQEVREYVGFDHELHGPSVHWNYERNSQFVVLSNYPLQDPEYVDVGRYQIYGVSDDSESSRIRISDRINDATGSRFISGTRVFYLAHNEMVERENPSVYLLTNDQVRVLLPSLQSESTGTDDLREAITAVPGFIDPP